MAESEVEKAAAEAYPKAPGYGYTFNRTRRQQREAFEAGWNAHASRLSRPTREELIEQACEFLHDAYEEAAVSAGWQTQEASRTSWDDLPIANKATMRVAVAALFREFSLSASEEDWEYGAMDVDDYRPVSIRGTHEEGLESQRYYERLRGRPVRLLMRTKAVPAGPWLPVPAPETGEN